MSGHAVSDVANLRGRVLHAALALALSVVVLASTTGCSALTDAYCGVFTGTRFCCERSGSAWDATTRSCHAILVLPSS